MYFLKKKERWYQQNWQCKGLHVYKENIGKKLLEMTFSELWKLIKGLYKSGETLFFFKTISWMSKNSNPYGILTFTILILLLSFWCLPYNKLQ